MNENGTVVAEILQIQVFTTCIIGVTGNKLGSGRVALLAARVEFEMIG